jgi:ABC-type ATPase involved in cell division
MTLLRVEHVSWSSWRAGRAADVLRDVSLEVDAGVFAGAGGRRAATTAALAAIVAGRLAPDAGAVLLDDRPLGDLARGGGALARIGFASRHGPELDDMGVLTWMASGLIDSASWRTARRRAWTAIDRVGLGAAASLRWPDLSAGERALAGIAQALVRGPRLLVVDGLLGDLDGDERGTVLDLLQAFAGDGVGILATAADVGELTGSTALFTLDDGRLTGPPPRPPARVIPFQARRRAPGDAL